MVQIIKNVLAIPIDDEFEWVKVEGEALMHPEMEQSGIRMVCHFLLGHLKGIIRMDMALGDAVDPIKVSLHRMRYKDAPVFGEDFLLLAYPPEPVFSEKLYIACKKGGRNTRMKDYYDLLRLSDHDLDQKKLYAL